MKRAFHDGGVKDRLEQMRKNLGEDTLFQVIEHYRRQGPELVAAICRNVGAKDFPAVRRDAHDLTGIAGVLGATSFQEGCSTLIVRARAEDQEGCHSLLADLERRHRRLLATLDSFS